MTSSFTGITDNCVIEVVAYYNNTTQHVGVLGFASACPGRVVSVQVDGVEIQSMTVGTDCPGICAFVRTDATASYAALRSTVNNQVAIGSSAVGTASSVVTILVNGVVRVTLDTLETVSWASDPTCQKNGSLAASGKAVINWANSGLAETNSAMAFMSIMVGTVPIAFAATGYTDSYKSGCSSQQIWNEAYGAAIRLGWTVFAGSTYDQIMWTPIAVGGAPSAILWAKGVRSQHNNSDPNSMVLPADYTRYQVTTTVATVAAQPAAVTTQCPGV